MIHISRRIFLQYTSFFIALLSISSFKKANADNSENIFDESNSSVVIDHLTSNGEVKSSERIGIKAPEIAENGAVVPVTVNTDIANVNKISILVDNNPNPLTSSFEINPQLEAFISTRVKMAKTSNIIALVSTTEGQHFSASRSIKVTIGGCGG